MDTLWVRQAMTGNPNDNLKVNPVVAHVRGVSGFGGGPEKTIFNSPRLLSRHGYDSFCAYMHRPDDPGFATLVKLAEVAKAELISIPDRGPWDLGVVRQLIRLCRERRAAIWHGHDYKSNVVGLIVNRFWPMRLVTTVHGWVDKSGRMPLYEAIDRRALRFYDQVICVSDDLYEDCRSMKIPTERCHLMRNGIDTEGYRRRMTIAEAKAQASARPERLLVGAAGRLASEKGFEHLIQAVASLIDAGQPIDLWIAGDGAARGELERLIQQTGHPEHIRLLGQLTDPKVFFQACDMYVLSSLREGLPNVVLEAMALEVPVIATRIAGIPALVEDGVSGLVVDAGSPEAIRAAVLRLVENPELRLELTRAARAKVENSHSFADRIGREVAIYDKLLGRQPRSTAAGTGAELSLTGS